MQIDIPTDLKERICSEVEKMYGAMPFKHRGITITCELLIATIQILNDEPKKILCQNSRNEIAKKTPDGLDRRIKETIESNLRTANIVSDVLETVGIVKITSVTNPNTGRAVKATQLRREWIW